MGFLNHLFGGEKGRAKEAGRDAAKRPKLWKEHLALHEKKEQLVKFFKFNQLDAALADPKKLKDVLAELLDCIDEDVVDIEGEETLEDEIVEDLAHISSKEKKEESTILVRHIAAACDSTIILEERLRDFFRKIHDVLQVELHTIKLLQKKLDEPNPDNEQLKGILKNLFNLVFLQEGYLYKPFQENAFFNDDLPAKIEKLTHWILLEKEIEHEVVDIDDEFVKIMSKQMGHGSEHEDRELGEDIFKYLLRLDERKFEDLQEEEQALRTMTQEVKDGTALGEIKEIITGLKPHYPSVTATVDQIAQAFMIAVRKAHFIMDDILPW